MHISLGCNCHPAWWLSSLRLREAAMPFDWILGKPADFMRMINRLVETNFDEWLLDLDRDQYGHVIDKKFPQVQLYHHYKLLSRNKEEAHAEYQKLLRRSERFKKALRTGRNRFFFFYPLTWWNSNESFQEEVYKFSRDKTGSLLIYFVSDYDKNGRLTLENDEEIFSVIASSYKACGLDLFLKHHRRDLRVGNGVMGQEPDFLRNTHQRLISSFP